MVPDIKDGIRWGVGVEYLANEILTLRAGYFYDECSVRSSSFSPLTPGLNISELRIGFAINLGNWEIDTSYAYAFFEDRTSSGPFPGKYDGFMPVLSLGLSHHFR